MHRLIVPMIAVSLSLFGLVAVSGAQIFDNISTGADGALNLTTPGVVEFDPAAFDPPLDPEGDHIYHFTTINIAEGVTVRLKARKLNGPVFWLASGAVQIDGVIDLNGEPGQEGADLADASPAMPGAGGFPGGIGGTTQIAQFSAGLGPGGAVKQSTGAGHLRKGQGPLHCLNCNGGGSAYGNNFLQPLIGGSGGAGGPVDNMATIIPGGGGGAGGGAILIASSVTISVNGSIQANGGNGGVGPRIGSRGGGGGSGGSIRLVAPSITGIGSFQVNGGVGGAGPDLSGYNGSPGWLRLETFESNFIHNLPGVLHLPDTPPPTVRLASIGGVTINNPTGSFTVPDAVIDTSDPVTLNIEARHVPLDTTVNLVLWADNGGTLTATSSPLAGTLELSTATIEMTIPVGFSRGFVSARWTP